MRTKNLEDVYKLSPMQQGMLFHTLYEPQAGEYVVQFTFTLEGKLSIPHLEQAWQEVVNRHPALRTSFQWKGLEKPLQVVHRQLTVVIERHDWRDTAVDQRRERLERFLSEDRCRGFDVTKAPLMRLVLMELGGGVFYFLWSHHHLLLDGWSLPLVFREVLACYEAFSRGRSLALPQPRPYREFISWLQQQDGTGAEHFWRRALAGISGPTPLGIDRPASGDPDEEKTYGEHRWWLDEATTAALLAQARRCSLTPNTLLQGAWALLLSRYSRAGEVLFGIAVAGRPAALPGVESMVGMFINTLPARVRVAEIAPCLAWLREMQDRQLDARQHEHVPLMDIHAWSEVPRGTPLLESLLVYENFPVPTSLHQGDGELEVRDVQFMDMSNFPLTIKATPGARLRLRCVFDRTRIDPEPALRLLGHLGTLLGEMATDLERPLAELSHLTPPEWHQVLVEWNDSRVGWNADRCLHDLIREQVERTPETVAVCFEGEQLTYRELNDRANQLAHRLRALGVGRDGLVGVCLERSLELVVALLGILKAGGAYVPLDPEYPRERLAYIIEDCGASAVLVGPGWEGALPAPVLALERGGGDLAAESTSEPAGGATPSSLAYVIYTSGSTGRPKGVMNSHRGIVNRLFWMQQAYGLDASDRVIQKTPFTFDVSVWEFFWPLLTGARLVVARPGGHKELAYLVDRMVDEGVTTLHFVPSMLRIFLEEPDLERCASLRRVICSGEALPPDLVRAFHERLHAELHNLYGPTEAAVDVTAWPCPPDVAAMIPIGRPIANTAIYLLAGGHPVPIGVPGELFIGGLPPARGYVANPALTSASFVPDAWSGEAGARAYRTGDLARYLPDGSIEYLGRLDHQVKIRGFRIELGEIERVLGEHAAVRDAAVVVRGEGGGEKRLAAFFVAAQGARPAAGELRAFLAERLPDYMLPSLFVQLDALPLTTSGKVDRRALVALEEPAPEAERPYIPPRTPIEEVVAGLWASALGLERVGVEDNFLDLGGNSLLAMRLIASIRQVFEVQLPFRVLFRTPTVAGVSAHIEKMRQEGRGLQPLPMTRIARDGDLPLSFAQQRLWFLDQWEPGSPFYNMALPLRVRSRLSPAVLERSLGEIVRRHEILRTTFAAGPQGPVQVIAPFSGFALPLVDLSSLPAPARRRTARHLAQAEMGRPFQLDRGPLFRALLIRMESELHFLVVATHHIVFDGSVPVFLRELLALYGAFAAGRPSPLAEPAFQYADFAAWQRNWLQGEVLEAQLRYWREQLAGCDEPLELPADRPRPAVQTFGGAVRSFALPRSLSEAIQLLVRREGVTTHMALLAAFKTLLFRYTERQDLSVGSPAQDRPCPEVEGLIGSFTNTLVLRTKLSGDLGFRELLARVREVSLGAYTYQDLPFEMVVESLQPHRSLSHTPLFQVMFVFLNAPVEAASRRESSGLDLSIVSFDRETARFDLLLTVSESHEGLFGVLEYRTDLFDGVTIARLGEHWVRLL
ncbi:MAG TPA: amino acid adenylation domain-containing protein, partial [Thermoanaerobaculia bacterium]|nr:amino acid adenylation domain-containing protein [Thermoanaerobaculia bacterium]